MPVRLKDIARDLGVSVVTVSKVLRNHSDIGEETRQRVLRRVKELNYRPNFAARALITGRTYTAGLVVPDLIHPFFAQIAKSLAGALRLQGYGLILASSEDDAELEKTEIDNLLARGVDALFIASAQWSVESFRRIEEHGVPYVLIDRHFRGLAAHFVGMDDEAAGVLATSHLLEQGCRRVAHIRGPEVSTGIGRFEGYRRALAAQGMVALPGHVVAIGSSGDDRGDAAGYQAAQTLLAASPMPDGIFCYNDPTATGAMRAIFDAGLRIPEDIAIVGCGNVFYADFLRVPLSTIDQNSAVIGSRAAELALALVAKNAAQAPEVIQVEPHLIVRASSARLTVNSGV